MGRLNIGNVWRMTADIVRRHFSTFITLAAAFVLLPSVLASTLFPQFGAMPIPVPGQPQQPFPVGLFLLIGTTSLIALVSHFAIAAIAADPAEGGGRSIGEIITGVLPKIGKGLFAGAYLVVAYITVGLLIGIVLSILAAMFGAWTGLVQTRGSAAALPQGGLTTTLGWLIAAIVLPLTIWVTARLLPLLGVLLREPLTAVDSIKRAWALSRGAVGPIVGVVVLVAAVSVLTTLILEQLRHALGINAGVALLLFTIVRSAVSALIAVYYYTAVAVIYRQLTEPR